MSDRSQNYWSIGEVLSLLQDEFPEVTISKIRFLESQGLIDPERTPSGYRRFYQIDFDRLQWILTQQRDHYLPLKVIRDRLEAGEWHSTAEDRPGPDDGTRQMTLLAPVINIRNGEPSSPGDASGASADESDTEQFEASEPAEGDASDESGSVQGSGDSEDPSKSADGAASPSAAAAGEATRAAHAATVAAPGATSDDQNNAADSAGTDSVESTSSSDDADTVAPPAGKDHVVVAADKGADVVESPATQAMADVDPGIALTLDEIAEASGCDVAMIRELERFALVKGRTVGPTVLYDGEALTIARHASQFRTFGLDPRHLRTFLVGAEREVALLAQVVEPLRHRRDPETRRKSVETMEDLTDLAASLRAILMRQITREQLPPT